MLAVLCVLLVCFCATAENPEWDHLITQAQQLDKQGHYDQAAALLERAVEKASNEKLGDQAVATSLSALATAYYRQGQPDRAEPLYVRAHQILEKLKGPQDFETVAVLVNLASVYSQRPDSGGAETMFRQGIAVFQRALPVTRVQLAETHTNFAIFLAGQGRSEDADQNYERAISLNAGEVSTTLIYALNGRGLLYHARGQYQAAERLFQQALAADETVFGSQHPETAATLTNLAACASARGDYRKAEKLYLRALEIGQRSQGAEHPSVAMVLSGLAEVYQAQGQLSKALSGKKRASEILAKAFGRGHRRVMESMNNLATLSVAMNRLDEAEATFRNIVEVSDQPGSPSSLLLATSLNNLAEVDRRRGRYAQAEPLYRRAILIMEQLLGVNHPDRASAVYNLAENYRMMDKERRAEPLYLEALGIYEKSLGPDHPYVADCLSGYAVMLRHEHRKQEAALLEARAKDIRAKHASQVRAGDTVDWRQLQKP